MGISLSGGPFTYNRFNLNEGAKPDFLDMDKDGNKKESFKKAVKDKKDCGCKKEEDCDCSDKKKEVKEEKGSLKQARKNVGADTCWDGYKAKGTKNKNGKSVPNCVKETVTITKSDVWNHLIENNYVTNEVSAEVVFNSITDEFLEKIEADITEGFKPLPTEKMGRQANNAYGKEQQAVKSGDQAGANKQMQRRLAMKDPSSRKQGLVNQNSNK